ncbi:MAG: hypothetical protein ACOYIQ_06310 [Christensenellales bacterium]|jgi:hypothetical protein
MQIKEELEKLGYTVDVNLGKDGVAGSIPAVSSKKRLFSLENGRFLYSFVSYSQDFFENIRPYLPKNSYLFLFYPFCPNFVLFQRAYYVDL